MNTIHDGYPTRWGEFLAYCPTVQGNEYGRFFRFASRYRMANLFEGIIYRDHDPSTDEAVKGFKDRTAGGYNILLGHAFAFVALDSLDAAVKKTPEEWNHKISKGQESVYLRSEGLHKQYFGDEFEDFRSSLEKHLDAGSKSAINNVQNNSNCNIRPIAKGIRHLTLHGEIAPGTIKLESTHIAQFLRDLREIELEETDKAFSMWVDREMAAHAKTPAPASPSPAPTTKPSSPQLMPGSGASKA